MEEKNTVSPEKKKILIVEDETSLSYTLQTKLKSEGFIADVAANGADALEMLSKDSYDLIMLDLIMPILDGYAVLEKLREKRNNTPVIVITNVAGRDDEKRVLDLGAKKFFIKADMPLSDIVAKAIETFA